MPCATRQRAGQTGAGVLAQRMERRQGIQQRRDDSIAQLSKAGLGGCRGGPSQSARPGSDSATQEHPETAW